MKNETKTIRVNKSLTSDWTRTWHASLPIKITTIVLWGVALIGLVIAVVQMWDKEITLKEQYSGNADRLSFQVIQILSESPDLSLNDFINQFETKVHGYGFSAAKIVIDNRNFQLGDPRENDKYTYRKVPIQHLITQNQPRTVEITVYHPDWSVLLRTQRKQLLWLMVTICLVFGLFLTWIMHRVVARPFEALVSTTQAISEGRLDIRIDADRPDEFGQLAKIFNQMLDVIVNDKKRLATQNHALIQYGESLENRVLERTRDLAIARDEALAASRTKSVFLANMSHEIRTPLTAIIGFAESIQETGQSADEKSQLIISITRNGRHLLDIINEILDMSKIEANRLDIEALEFSPFQIIDDVNTIVSAQAKEKNLHFIIENNDPLPNKVKSDPTRIKQVLLNLCSNALKFTSEGSIRMKINFDEAQSLLKFSIIDTGIGMSEAQLAKLFQPFTQADSSTTRKYGGTGLGLYITKRLVEVLGGTLDVRSLADMGTRFDVAIKVALLEKTEIVDGSLSSINEHQQIENSAPVIPENLSGTILLAEDNKDNQQLISLILKGIGVEMTMVDNGRQAVDLALSKDYDLILMDMQMPVLDGLSATRQLREKGYRKPIVALTANVMIHNIEEYLDAGCDTHVSKPIDRNRLYEILKSYLTPAPVTEPQKQTNMISRQQKPDVIDEVPIVVSTTHKKQEQLYGNILYAEDNPNIQRLVALLVKSVGVTLTIVENGELAIEKALAENFDLVLMDMQMPVMGGIEATQWLRRAGFKKPIVALTANVMKTEVETYMKVGCTDCISKPIDRKVFFSVLRTYLKTSETYGDSYDANAEWDENPEYKKLANKFFESLPTTVEDIEAAIRDKQWEHLKFLAHALKGTAGSFGFQKLSDISVRLQDEALNEDEEVLNEIYEELLDNVCDYINQD